MSFYRGVLSVEVVDSHDVQQGFLSSRNAEFVWRLWPRHVVCAAGTCQPHPLSQLDNFSESESVSMSQMSNQAILGLMRVSNASTL